MLLSDGGDVLGLPAPGRQFLVGAPVEVQGLVEAVLAVEDVGGIAVQARQAQAVSVAVEDGAGLIAPTRAPGRSGRDK